MNSHLKDHLPIWLGTMLAINLVLGALVFFGFLFKGNNLVDAFWSTSPAQAVFLLEPNKHQDSWSHMLLAYRWKIEHPEGGLYDLFFAHKAKFQYPPSSLLFLDLFPAWMTEPVSEYGNPGKPLLWWLDGLSTVTVIVTALVCGLILEVGLHRLNPQQPVRPASVAIRLALVIALCLTSYPLTVAHWLGQIQVFLTFLAALGLLFHLLGWEALSGACFGLCCLVKPQWGLLMLWALLRRRWRFAGGLLAVLLPGLALSLTRYSWQDHLQYLEVLRFISRVGESFWANQSVNGLLNRILQNGDPYGTSFAPYNFVVYIATLISTLVILVIAFWLRHKDRSSAGGTVDLSVVLIAATIASPVAWHHHYGVFLPVMALALPGLMQTHPLGRWTLPLLGLSYLAIANAVIRPELIYRNYWISLAGWHMFYGGLIFSLLLLALRASGWQGQRVPAARRSGKQVGAGAIFENMNAGEVKAKPQS